MLPKVSIIIPIYNVEPYIEECLQSVMRQSYRGIMECILVDDCGTDNSMEIAKQFIEVYNGPIGFKVLHHEHNRGVSAARNTGMDIANGDYIYFLDSDDWISDDCIEKLAHPLSIKQYDFIVGDWTIEGMVSHVYCQEGEYHRKGLRPIGHSGINVAVWNKLFRKSFLIDNQLSFEVGKILEDAIFSFDLACVERKYYVVKSITYFYRRREGSITMPNNKSDKVLGYVGLFQSLRDRVRQDKYKERDGIYDYYMLWVKRAFGMISRFEMDETILNYVQKETKDFLDVVPNIRYLGNKHDRLIYVLCRNNQTYLRFQYANMYDNRLSGRIMRNLLNLIPSKKVKP